MKEFLLETRLLLARPRDEVFPFFANAHNLEAITPPWLNFEVFTPGPIVMRPGTLIDYRIRIRGFQVRWRTKIAVWQPPYQFVDEQLQGPYKLWHHTHRFEERDGGTLCTDRVRYYPRGGAWVNWLFVRRDLEEIFGFRRQRLLALFPA